MTVPGRMAPVEPASVRAAATLLVVQGAIVLLLALRLLPGLGRSPAQLQGFVTVIVVASVAVGVQWALAKQVLVHRNWARAVALVLCGHIALAAGYGTFGDAPVQAFAVLCFNVVIIALLLDRSSRAWCPSDYGTVPWEEGEVRPQIPTPLAVALTLLWWTAVLLAIMVPVPFLLHDLLAEAGFDDAAIDFARWVAVISLSWAVVQGIVNVLVAKGFELAHRIAIASVLFYMAGQLAAGFVLADLLGVPIKVMAVLPGLAWAAVVCGLLLHRSSRVWPSRRRSPTSGTSAPGLEGSLQWRRPPIAWEARHGWGVIALAVMLLLVNADMRPRTDAENAEWFGTPVEAYFTAVAETDAATILDFDRRMSNGYLDDPYFDIAPSRGLDLEPELVDSAVGWDGSVGWLTYHFGMDPTVDAVEFRVDYRTIKRMLDDEPLYASLRLNDTEATEPPFTGAHGRDGFNLALADVHFSGFDLDAMTVRIEDTELAATGSYQMLPGVYQVDLLHHDGRPSESFEFTAVPGFFGESAIDFEYLGSGDTLEAVVRDEAVAVASNCYLGGVQHEGGLSPVKDWYECPFGPEEPIGYVVEIHSIELHGLEVTWNTSFGPDPERPWHIVDQIAWHASFETATATARMADGQDHTFTFDGGEFDWCSPTWAEC